MINIAKMSKEELTRKMHSEFNVPESVNVKLTAFMALSDMQEFGYSYQDVISLYDITIEEIKSFEHEFHSL